jgi:maltose-binding protein MalE
MPGYLAARDTEYFKTDPWLNKFLPFTQYGRPLPKHPAWSEIEEILVSSLNSIYLEGEPVKESLDEAAKKAEDVLMR